MGGSVQADPTALLVVSGPPFGDTPYEDTTVTPEPTPLTVRFFGTEEPQVVEFTSHLSPAAVPGGLTISKLRFTAIAGGLRVLMNPVQITLSDGSRYCAPPNQQTMSPSFTRLQYVNKQVADFALSFSTTCNGDPTTSINANLSYIEPALLAPDLVTVRGRAWDDVNRNGVRDPGEFLIPGASIAAVAQAAMPPGAGALAEQRVRVWDDGFYEIKLRPLAYRFLGTCPQNYGPTTADASNNDTTDNDFSTAPNDFGAQGTGPVLDLSGAAAGAVVTGPDLGCRNTRNVIAGHLWYDRNRNGQRDGGEDASGQVRLMRFNVSTQAWDLFTELNIGFDGQFSAEVDPGRWRIEFPLAQRPPGEALAPTLLGAAQEFNDSDLLPDGTTPPVDVGGGGLWQDFDVGYIDPVGTVTGRVWRDLNGDGVCCFPDEPGVFGVSVSLLHEGVVVDTVTTDEGGTYLFHGVVEGSGYRLRLNMDIPAERRRRAISPHNAFEDWADSDLDPATLLSDPFSTLGDHFTVTGGDIGLKVPGLGTVSGQVWNDLNANGLRERGEPPLRNFSVAVWPGPVQNGGDALAGASSDARGQYSMDVAAGANRLLRAYLPYGWELAPRGVNGANDSDAGGPPFTLRVDQTLRRDIGVYQPARTSVSLADYWPLYVGARWTYSGGGAANLTLRVTAKRSLHGSEVYTVSESGTGNEYLISLDRQGLRLHGYTLRGADSRLQGEALSPMPWAPASLRGRQVMQGNARVKGTLSSGGESESGEGALKYRTTVAWRQLDSSNPVSLRELDVRFTASGRVSGLAIAMEAGFILRPGVGPTRWRTVGGDVDLIRYTLDPDGDRINADHDNCLRAKNASQADRDVDGVGDVCDLDDDDDTVLDSRDNCPLLTNADQKNRDGDTRGDACDRRPTVRDKP
ncbi:MAG: thrombospondin type 3 repeat-containing protein [Gammaproteobacteria bacterium]|nr:thrombospondin type 3 repeat-containing protein [Gammaproteobacteria bacterium]